MLRDEFAKKGGASRILRSELKLADAQKNAVTNLMIAHGAKDWACELKYIPSQEAQKLVNATEIPHANAFEKQRA